MDIAETDSSTAASVDPDAIKTCSRCVMNTTVPGIKFDRSGMCNFCHLHDKLDARYSLDDKGKREFKKILSVIKRSGRKNQYDCVLGVSGGRDSTYLLYMAKCVWGLRPLAVHFNDGFGNPVAGQNMVKAARKLGVELRTVTSDWRESKDLKIAFLKASTPDMEEGTDIGIATALYGMAAKENIKYVLIGQSFRTEGIAPLSWNYLDGRYLKSVHRQFGSVSLRPWKPFDPGFNLGIREMMYYCLWKRIRTVPPFYFNRYSRPEAEEIIKSEFDWVYPGAHYYDDLYQSLMAYVNRIKFNIDRRLFNYSALVRSGEMERQRALENMKEIYVIEDEKVIDLCIKRLGITRDDFDGWVTAPVKTFRDYPNYYSILNRFRWVIKFLSILHLLPATTYDKYFNCGT